MKKIIPLLKKIYKRYKKTINPICILLIAIFFPIFIDYCIIGNKFPSNIDNSDWVSFLGSYIGAFCTLAGIWWTINFTREQAEKDRKCANAQALKDREYAKEQADEERRYQHRPFLRYNCYRSFSENKENSMKCLTYSFSKQANMYVILYVSIKNIGLGPAVDVKLGNAKYNELEAINWDYSIVDFDVGEESVIKLKLNIHQRFDLEESQEHEDIERVYVGNVNSNLLQQNWFYGQKSDFSFILYFRDIHGKNYYYTQDIKVHLDIFYYKFIKDQGYKYAQTNIIPSVFEVSEAKLLKENPLTNS